MRRFICVAGLIMMLASSLLAVEDLTGQWSGTFNRIMDGETVNDVILMKLKQNGMELTGSAGPSAELQWQIQKGKIDGNKITFEVQTPEPLIKFALTLADGHLKGDARAEHEGRTMKAVVDAQRKTD